MSQSVPQRRHEASLLNDVAEILPNLESDNKALRILVWRSDMPRTGKILQVFVASPNDVAEERATLEDVIRELNITWSKELGIYLELVKWETHAYPSVGTDPQAIINEELGDNYDIFIGIMWTRFGTPTGRAGSGTSEEFQRAYSRYQNNPDQIRIMFYFKDAPIPPSKLDPEQLASIKAFQTELGDQGTLYWTYTSLSEFTQLVRLHLTRQVQSFGKSWGLETKETPKHEKLAEELTPQEMLKSPIHDEHPKEEEEEGFLDLAETGQEKFEAMIEGVHRMTAAIKNLDTKLEEHTEEFKLATPSGGAIEVKQAKRISNRVAEEMNDFATLMEVEVPFFAKSYSGAIEAYIKAITLSKDIGDKDIEKIESTKAIMQEFKATLSGTQSAILSFRHIVASIPRATTMLNRAKRRVTSILDRLAAEIATALNLTSEIEKVIDQMLGN